MPWLWGICNPRGPSANRHMNWCYEALREWSNKRILKYRYYSSYDPFWAIIYYKIEVIGFDVADDAVIYIQEPVIEPLTKGLWGYPVRYCASFVSCMLSLWQNA